MTFRASVCVVAGLGLLTSAGCSQSEKTSASVQAESGKAPIIGDFPAPGTDIGCWFYRSDTTTAENLIFYYDTDQNSMMRIDGEDVQLSQLEGNPWRLKAGRYLVIVEHSQENPCEEFEAKITIRNSRVQTIIPARGTCGCEPGIPPETLDGEER